MNALTGIWFRLFLLDLDLCRSNSQIRPEAHCINPEEWVATLSLVRGSVVKLVVHPLATAALWVRIQTSLKNHKWMTQAKGWAGNTL
jgi:hypothetical protein